MQPALPKSATDASLRLALPPLPPGSRTRHGADGPSRGGCSCRPICRPGSMSRKWKPVPDRSKGWARPWPPSSAWPAAGPFNAPTLVTNWSQFTSTFGDFVEGSYLHHAVYGYFQNGGGTCLRRAHRWQRCGVAGRPGGADDEHRRRRWRRAASLGAFRVQALAEGAEGNDISVEIADTTAEGAAEDAFKLIVKKGNNVEETFDNVTTKRGRQNVVTVVNAQSKLIRLEDLGVSRRDGDPGHGRPVRRGSARARASRPRRLRRRSVRPHRFRRPGGHRRGDHGLPCRT